MARLQEGADGKARGTEPTKAGGAQLSHEERREAIARAAWRRAEQRGFQDGYALDDWLAAEREIDGKTD
jgi:hypothetical protein